MSRSPSPSEQSGEPEGSPPAFSQAGLLPGAFLVAVGFQLLHATVVCLLVPKLESSTSLYGELGAIATILFFMYLGARLLVTAPILNSSLHAELRERGRAQQEPAVP